MPHQQSPTFRKLSVILIRSRTNQIGDLLPLVEALLQVLAIIQPGQTATTHRNNFRGAWNWVKTLPRLWLRRVTPPMAGLVRDTMMRDSNARSPGPKPSGQSLWAETAPWAGWQAAENRSAGKTPRRHRF